MKILVTGASGLIGLGVVKRLADNGHTVLPLTRNRSGPPPRWDPATGVIDLGQGLSFDAVVHLAGENIAGRWTAEKKRRIRDSRVQGTRLLCEALTRRPKPPQVLLCASAIGIYGNRSDEMLDEGSASGAGFLAEVCREWEAAALSAAEKGIRVVNLRLGIVLTPRGGALKAMLWPFRLGLGGRVGNGQQYLSWITLGDLERAADHALRCDQLQGPVNLVAPNPVTNQEFTRTLAHALNRPACLPMPGFVARTLFGEAADELLLASARVLPTRLRETGFQFEHPDLESALGELLKR
jgi:uncharacterized protein